VPVGGHARPVRARRRSVAEPRCADRWTSGRAARAATRRPSRGRAPRGVAHSAPWHGPIVAALYRFKISEESTLVPGLLGRTRDVLAHADVPVGLGDGPRVCLACRPAHPHPAARPDVRRPRSRLPAERRRPRRRPRGRPSSEGGCARRPAEESTNASHAKARRPSRVSTVTELTCWAACFWDATDDQRDLPAARASTIDHPRSCSRRRRFARRPGPPGCGHPVAPRPGHTPGRWVPGNACASSAPVATIARSASTSTSSSGRRRPDEPSYRRSACSSRSGRRRREPRPRDAGP
jgi:hypothetical protein